MKGLFFVRLGVILLLLTSCLKEEEPQQGKTVLEFSVEQTQAKIAPGNNDGTSITLLWEAGDNQVIPFNVGYTQSGNYVVRIDFNTMKITFTKIN